MKIIKAEVIVTSPDRNFVSLKVTTDEGHTGLGDATLNGRELAVVSYLKDHVARCLSARIPTASKTHGSFCTAARTGGVALSRWLPSPRSTSRSGMSKPRPRTCRSTSSWAGPAVPDASPTAMPAARICRNSSTRYTGTWSRATGLSGFKQACPDFVPSTALRQIRSRRGTWASVTTTNRRNARRFPQRKTGTPEPTCDTYQASSMPCAPSSVPSSRSCTTDIIG